MPIEGTNQWTEADFRFELVTVRQRAETIAARRLSKRGASFWSAYLLNESWFEMPEFPGLLYLL